MSNKYKTSRNLGFITGPLMIGMGIFALQGNKVPQAFAYFFIVMGIIRLGLSAFVYFKSSKED